MRQFIYSHLKGKQGYKLQAPYELQTDFTLILGGTVGCVTLQNNGLLRIEKGFRWDGASGPARDDRKTLRASMIHDACYQLLRRGIFGLPGSDSWWYARRDADKLMRKLMRQDGASKFRAWYYYWALRLFAGYAAKE